MDLIFSAAGFNDGPDFSFGCQKLDIIETDTPELAGTTLQTPPTQKTPARCRPPETEIRTVPFVYPTVIPG
jgi:hypothetical protein